MTRIYIVFGTYFQVRNNIYIYKEKNWEEKESK
jgi:hypothetical protein